MSDKRFHGDRWFNKRVEGRTKEALRQREAEFAQTHADVSDEALLDYVRGELLADSVCWDSPKGFVREYDVNGHQTVFGVEKASQQN